jgi:Tol biopolymer transport system component/DNA-binding winged helix-turn-helix (wHTH) protein
VTVVIARYRWDDLVLDLDAYRLERHGVPLPLEPKAFDLLALMVQRPQHLFTKQEILEKLWPDAAVTDHALTRVVAQLRRALGDDARESRYIETVPGRGYRWIAPAVLDSDTPPGVQPPAPSAARPIPVDRRARAHAVLALAAAGATLSLAIGVGILRSPVATPGTGGRLVSAGGAAVEDHPRGEVAWPVQVTTHVGLDMHPAFSPLDDALAYTSDRTGAFELYVRALASSAGDVRLTTDHGDNVQPAWSPDGRLLAYHSSRHGGIWIIPARGGVARQLVATGSNPAWSPDGRSIAFQSDEQPEVTPGAYGAQQGSTIWTVDADGRERRELTRRGQPAGGHAAPAWSPDGRHVAFAVFEGGGDNGIWILPLDTPVPRRLVHGGGFSEIAFAPDGSALYASGGEAFVARLPFDAAAGTLRGPRSSIPVGGVPGVRGLAVSADSRRLAFAGPGLTSQIWAQPVLPDGSPAGLARPLTVDTSRRNSLPTVSPDGTKVAYVSVRAGLPSNVWVMDVDGRNSLPLTTDENAEGVPGWFPDSRRVAYLSRYGDDATAALWVVDIATRQAGALLALSDPSVPDVAGKVLAELDLAASMTRAAFSLLSPAGRAIWVTPLDRFAPRTITDPAYSVGYPAWSPDERRLAVEIKDGSSVHAGVVDLETGSMRRLTSERGQTWVRSWSPDGRKIAAAVLREGRWDLRWIDADTGRQGSIAPPHPPNVYVRYPDWSPRGDLVVFERGELRGNIWTLALP